MIKDLIKQSLNRPSRINVDPLYNSADNRQEKFVRIRKGKESAREAIRVAFCKSTYKHRIIIIFRTKRDGALYETDVWAFKPEYCGIAWKFDAKPAAGGDATLWRSKSQLPPRRIYTVLGVPPAQEEGG